jgi:hypothetical protein
MEMENEKTEIHWDEEQPNVEEEIYQRLWFLAGDMGLVTDEIRSLMQDAEENGIEIPKDLLKEMESFISPLDAFEQRVRYTPEGNFRSLYEVNFDLKTI